jgi:hypothetical protein
LSTTLGEPPNFAAGSCGIAAIAMYLASFGAAANARGAAERRIGDLLLTVD